LGAGGERGGEIRTQLVPSRFPAILLLYLFLAFFPELLINC